MSPTEVAYRPTESTFMNITTQGRLLPLAAALALVAAPASALSVNFSNGTDQFTVNDGGTLDDDGDTGRLEYTSDTPSTLAGWSTLSAVATSCLNSIDCPNLTLDFEVNSDGAAGDLTIAVTETDLMLGDDVFVFESSVSGTAADQISVASYYDPSNAAFGQAMQIGDAFDFDASGAFGAYSQDEDATAPGASPFSLTTIYSITHDAGGTQTLGDSKVIAASPVPVPAALPLLAGALGVSGLVLRRRGGRA